MLILITKGFGVFEKSVDVSVGATMKKFYFITALLLTNAGS